MDIIRKNKWKVAAAAGLAGLYMYPVIHSDHASLHHNKRKNIAPRVETTTFR